MSIMNSRKDMTVAATVIDADTMRYGCSFFKRERTCTYDSAEDYSLVCSACGWNRRGALIIPNYCPHCGARVENANEDELAATHHGFQEVGE